MASRGRWRQRLSRGKMRPSLATVGAGGARGAPPLGIRGAPLGGVQGRSSSGPLTRFLVSKSAPLEAWLSSRGRAGPTVVVRSYGTGLAPTLPETLTVTYPDAPRAQTRSALHNSPSRGALGNMEAERGELEAPTAEGCGRGTADPSSDLNDVGEAVEAETSVTRPGVRRNGQSTALSHAVYSRGTQWRQDRATDSSLRNLTQSSDRAARLLTHSAILHSAPPRYTREGSHASPRVPDPSTADSAGTQPFGDETVYSPVSMECSLRPASSGSKAGNSVGGGYTRFRAAAAAGTRGMDTTDGAERRRTGGERARSSRPVSSPLFSGRLRPRRESREGTADQRVCDTHTPAARPRSSEPRSRTSGDWGQLPQGGLPPHFSDIAGGLTYKNHGPMGRWPDRPERGDGNSVDETEQRKVREGGKRGEGARCSAPESSALPYSSHDGPVPLRPVVVPRLVVTRDRPGSAPTQPGVWLRGLKDGVSPATPRFLGASESPAGPSLVSAALGFGHDDSLAVAVESRRPRPQSADPYFLRSREPADRRMMNFSRRSARPPAPGLLEADLEAGARAYGISRGLTGVSHSLTGSLSPLRSPALPRTPRAVDRVGATPGSMDAMNTPSHAGQGLQGSRFATFGSLPDIEVFSRGGLSTLSDISLDEDQGKSFEWADFDALGGDGDGSVSARDGQAAGSSGQSGSGRGVADIAGRSRRGGRADGGVPVAGSAAKGVKRTRPTATNKRGAAVSPAGSGAALHRGIREGRQCGEAGETGESFGGRESRLPPRSSQIASPLLRASNAPPYRPASPMRGRPLIKDSVNEVAPTSSASPSVTSALGPRRPLAPALSVDQSCPVGESVVQPAPSSNRQIPPPVHFLEVEGRLPGTTPLQQFPSEMAGLRVPRISAAPRVSLSPTPSFLTSHAASIPLSPVLVPSRGRHSVAQGGRRAGGAFGASTVSRRAESPARNPMSRTIRTLSPSVRSFSQQSKPLLRLGSGEDVLDAAEQPPCAVPVSLIRQAFDSLSPQTKEALIHTAETLG